jgi:hypothetical protein
MYEIVTIDQIKRWMKAEETSGDDDFFLHLQQGVSRAIEDYIDRKLVTRQYTEYYNGIGGESLLLNQYPVYDNDSNFSFWMDTERSFGASTLVDTDNYQVDTYSGLITMLETVTYSGKKVLKLQYYAGESRFQVTADANDYLDIDSANVQITAGEYIAETLATEIQTQLNAAGLTGTYTVSYNHARQKFSISNDTTTFTLKWKTGDNRLKTIATLIGYDSEQDKSAAQSYEADYAVTGLPWSISIAAEKLIHAYFSDSKRGDGKQTVLRKEVGGDITLSYDKKPFPDDVVQLLAPFRRFA